MNQDTLPDIHPQKQKITLTKAGVKGVKIPFMIFGRSTIVSVSAYVKGLETRGANMSRFARTFNMFADEVLDEDLVRSISHQLTKVHESDCTLKIRAAALFCKMSPATKSDSFSEYSVRFYYDTAEDSFVFGTDIAVSTVCPCSAELTGITGHMQRAVISIDIQPVPSSYLLEDDIKRIIVACEDEGSGQLYSVLRRADEKEVTNRMIGKPRFVEDVARGVIKVLEQEDIVDSFSVVVQSMESIHQYDVLGIYDSGTVNLKAL